MVYRLIHHGQFRRHLIYLWLRITVHCGLDFLCYKNTVTYLLTNTTTPPVPLNLHKPRNGVHKIFWGCWCCWCWCCSCIFVLDVFNVVECVKWALNVAHSITLRYSRRLTLLNLVNLNFWRWRSIPTLNLAPSDISICIITLRKYSHLCCSK